MAQIGVSAEVLCSVANDIRESNNVMQSNLVSIQESVRSLQGSWKGEAANQLTAIAASMDTMFVDFKKVVESFAAFLDNAAQNYKKAEAANVDNHSGVKSCFKFRPPGVCHSLRMAGSPIKPIARQGLL